MFYGGYIVRYGTMRL